jgi:metal-responsive CopG/Arc/MetJ family transcriptional regulator
MKSKTETIACKMPQNLVEAIDTLAERTFRSRSDILRQAAMKELEANGIVAIAGKHVVAAA